MSTSRFGHDKKGSFLSILTLTGEITREEANAQPSHQSYSSGEKKSDAHFIASKPRISDNEFESYMCVDKHIFEDFQNSYITVKAGTVVLRMVGKGQREYQ